MEYRRLGKSGLKVSRICLGSGTFGESAPASAAVRIVGSALDAGINFIDTSDSYGNTFGASERIVGPLIAKRRDYWVLASKFSRQIHLNDPNSGGLGRKWMMQALHGSLKRLKTDYVDIYYLHYDDLLTPVEETLRAMDDLIHAGKVRHFGLSNFQGWRIAELVRECDLLGVPRPIVVEPYYHALYRLAEVEILPACAYYGLGVVPYAVLARGVLTGKYIAGKRPPRNSRAEAGKARFLADEYRAESLRIAQQLKVHAEKKGLKLGYFALNWVLNNALVTSVLAGPRTLEQWQEYLAALRYSLDADDEAVVDRLVPRGHASTHGHVDRKYPITGRVLINNDVRSQSLRAPAIPFFKEDFDAATIADRMRLLGGDDT